VTLDLGKRTATLLMDGDPVARFELEREETLTSARARELDEPGRGHRLVAFGRSSPEARALLRERGLSYVAGNGELWIHAPPVHIERPARRRSSGLAPARSAPFAIRASRVPRWLLLHPQAHPSLRELGGEIGLSESIVSRTVRALADDGLVTVEADPVDGRRRRVRLRDSGALLDAFERATTGRRPRRQTVEVGARDIQQALRRLRMAAKRLQLPYAVSGLAGAWSVRRVVEPVTVDAWIGRDALELWMEELGAIPSRPGPGRLTLQLAPDPFVLSLASREEGIRIADPVQLYLDCRRSGERALEAADAIRAEMNW
jgi:DNA-binding MarR family transcriptional regulator